MHDPPDVLTKVTPGSVERAGAGGSAHVIPVVQPADQLLCQGRAIDRLAVALHFERRRRVAQLLWKGIADYVWKYDVALMFGCASLPGTAPTEHAVALTYLYHYHLAPPGLRARALESRFVEMRQRDPASINPRRALAELPPLIKGYLRLGGFVGDGAVVDHQFNTTDVLILVKTGWVTEKYREHFSAERVAKSGGSLD